MLTTALAVVCRVDRGRPKRKLSLCLSNPSGLQIEDRLTAAEPCDQTGQKADWTKWEETWTLLVVLPLTQFFPSAFGPQFPHLSTKQNAFKNYSLAWQQQNMGEWGTPSDCPSNEKSGKNYQNQFHQNSGKMGKNWQWARKCLIKKKNWNLVNFCGILTYLCPSSTPHSSGGLEDGIPRPWYGFLGPREALQTLSQDTIAVCLDLAMGSLED